jgi:hypothetical protein
MSRIACCKLLHAVGLIALRGRRHFIGEIA